MTLTQTFAWRRSGVVSTLVIVTNPIRGSATSRATIAVISWRSSSSTRSVRWLIGTPHGAQRAARQPATARLTVWDGEAFDDVALFEVVVVGEADAALVVGGDLADVVAEAAQRLDLVGRDDLAAAPDPRAAADDPAVGDVRAGDDGALADAEDLADLGATLDDLDHDRLEQALEGGARCRRSACR